jgi:DNA-binding PadR family transcriptional regulator
MDKVILGLLIIKAMSQYAIKKVLEQPISPFYQGSLGSIQSALKKLEHLAYIKVQRGVSNGRQKNIYTITNEGVEFFKIWMITPPLESKFDSVISTKLFFLGHMDKKDRVIVIEKTITFLRDTIKNFEDGEKVFREKDYDLKMKEVVKYQFSTLDLALNYYRNTLVWFENLLKEERL